MQVKLIPAEIPVLDAFIFDGTIPSLIELYDWFGKDGREREGVQYSLILLHVAGETCLKLFSTYIKRCAMLSTSIKPGDIIAILPTSIQVLSLEEQKQFKTVR